MSIEFIGIEWDGAGSSTGSGQVLCRVPRDTIHAIPFNSDAIEREIRSERHSILQRLTPALRAKLTVAGPSGWVELLPSDIFDRRSVPEATEASNGSSELDSQWKLMSQS